MAASTRWLVAVAGAVTVAVVVGVLVAALVDGEREFAPGTPEHTVQRYLRALADRDATTALALMSSDLETRCGTIPRETVTQRGEWRFRASLDETITRADVTEVHVRISETYGSPPFGGGESTWPHVFYLVQEEGEWRFNEVPWPLYCPGPPIRSSIAPRG